MKKYIIVGVLVFAFAFSMNAAFAGFNVGGNCYDNNFKKCACPDITNISTGDNVISSKVSTGNNVVYGGGFFSFGSAKSGVGIAGTEGLNAVNTNVGVNTKSFVVSNKSYGDNTISSKVYTGNNTVYGNGMVVSGDGQAMTKGINLVNTNVSINTCGCQQQDNDCHCQPN